LKNQPRIIFNTDGDLGLSICPRGDDLGPVCRVVDELADTQVDVVSYSINTGGDTYCHRSETAPILGEDCQRLDDLPPWLRPRVQTIRELDRRGTDVVKVLCRRSHDLGKQFWLSLRMNDDHDSYPGYEVLHGAFRRTHPELLIGDARPAGDEQGHRWTDCCWGFDYSHTEVRERQLALIGEAVDGYDADGIELDFLRGPCYFREGEADAGAAAMTELVRQVHARVRRASEKKGRALVLAARIDRTPGACAEKGLDVSRWLSEGLVDVAIPMHGGRLDAEADVAAFVRAAGGSGCRIYGGLEARCYGYGHLPDHDTGRWRHATIEMLRAAATGYYAQGADGVYLFNYEHRFRGLEGRYTPEELQALKEIGDPQTIARKSKRYVVTVDQTTEYTGAQEGRSFQLPARLDADGTERTFRFFIGDDLEAARRDGAVTRCRLRVTVAPDRPADAFAFRLNARSIMPDANVWRPYGLMFSNVALQPGPNHLSVSVPGGMSSTDGPVRVTGVEAIVTYVDGD
jgi:hypothetical protein